MGKSSSRKRQVFPSFLQGKKPGRGPSNSEQMKVTCENRDPPAPPLLPRGPFQLEGGSFSALHILSPPGLLVLGFGEQLVGLKGVRGAGCLPAPTHQEAGRAPALGIDLPPAVHPGWCSGKVPACQCRRLGFDPQVEDPLEEGMATHCHILAGACHGQRSLALQSMVSQSQT